MPGLKSAKTPHQRKEGPRDQRSHGFSRRICPAPSKTVVDARDVCPDCGTPLIGGSERWRKEVLDLPPLSPGAHHPSRVPRTALPEPDLWPPRAPTIGRAP
jgi:hypothetical protein